MTPNVGNIDRIARAVLGVILLIAPFLGAVPLFDSVVAATISVVVGLVLLATAATRLCPLYSMLGINTCRRV